MLTKKILSALMTAAESFIQKTTGKTQIATGVDELGRDNLAAISTDELYNTCVKMLVAHWYENRAVQAQLSLMILAIAQLINHIVMCGDYA